MKKKIKFLRKIVVKASTLSVYITGGRGSPHPPRPKLLVFCLEVLMFTVTHPALLWRRQEVSNTFGRTLETYCEPFRPLTNPPDEPEAHDSTSSPIQPTSTICPKKTNIGFLCLKRTLVLHVYLQIKVQNGTGKFLDKHKQALGCVGVLQSNLCWRKACRFRFALLQVNV